MSFLSSIREKIATKCMGELVAELGTLPIDDHRRITLSIRRRAGQSPHLQLKLAETGAVDFMNIPCTRDWADQLEKAAVEMRKQIDGTHV